LSVADACRVAGEVVKTGVADTEVLLYGTGRSLIKGLGYEYVDFRDYVYGDDPRHIDWRLSARLLTASGDYRLVVKEYVSERIVEAILAVDVSGYTLFWDKLHSVLYTTVLVLRAARTLGDKVHLLLLKGSGFEEAPLTDPAQLVHYVEHYLCRGFKTEYAPPLHTLPDALARYRGVRSIVVVTGFHNNPMDFSRVGDVAKSMNAGLAYVIATSRYELESPGVNPVVAVKSPAGIVALAKLSAFLREVSKHAALCRAYLSLATPLYLEALGYTWLRSQKHRVLRLYLESRLRYPRAL